jgi:hypothetical protein
MASTQADESPEQADRGRAHVILDAGLQGVLTSLEVARPELAPVVSMLGALALPALERLVGLTNERRLERAVYTVGLGIGDSAISVAEFEIRCRNDPRLLQLCTKIVTAAQDSVYEAKLRALARSLANALADGSQVDAEIVFASVLEGLEAPHVRLLAQFAPGPDGTVPGYNRIQLASQDPGLANVLESLLSTLVGSGLVDRLNAPGLSFGTAAPEHIGHQITMFGQYMLSRLRAEIVEPEFG